jgi:hypothetical protein
MGNLKPMKSPVSNAKLIGEILASVVATFAVGGGLSWTFYLAYSEFANAGHTWVGAVLGVGFLVIPSCIATITVYFIGRIGDQTGSFWITLGWSVLGGFWGIGIASGVPLALFLAPFLGAAIGAVIGFNWTRKHKEGREPK